MNKIFSEKYVASISILWIVGMACLVILKRQTLVNLELNSIGDFLAGAFAPLGFFWLVAGFYQQGKGLEQNSIALRMQAKELQQSTTALNLQVQEMRQSVDQQKKMVEIYKQELDEKHFQVEPYFNIRCINFKQYREQVPIDNEEGEIIDSYEQDAIDFYLEFENSGEIARNVKITNAEKGYLLFNKFEFNQKEKNQITFCVDGPECEYFYKGNKVSRKVILSYQNIFGKEYIMKIRCELSSHEDFETGELHIYCQAFIIN